MTRLFSRFLRKDREELGFTLIELIIVILVIGTLAGIAIPTHMSIQRDAVIATVKSDIKSSSTVLVRQLDESGYFVSEDYFNRNAAITGDNILVLMVDGAGGNQVACIWGSHVFGEGDIVSYHYSSDTGKIEDGGCLGVVPDGSTVIVGSGPGTEDPTADEHEHDEPSSPATQAPITGTPVVSNPAPSTPPPAVEPTYSSSKNKYPVCHNAGDKWHLLMLPYSGLINGHAGHGKDVIPPIAGKYGGHNWNADGWLTFRKYCS